jgi:hypothetical protein
VLRALHPFEFGTRGGRLEVLISFETEGSRDRTRQFLRLPPLAAAGAGTVYARSLLFSAGRPTLGRGPPGFPAAVGASARVVVAAAVAAAAVG